MIKTYPVVDGAKNALIGRIGDRETSRAYLIGPARVQKVALDGRLYLGINMLATDRVDGMFHVHIERIPAAAAAANAANASVTQLTQAELDSVPTRVVDKDGNLGDRVNFFVIGSEDQVRTALDQGGWTTVDKTKKQAILDGLINSLSKQAYVSMPMSELMLFGRVQDYGFLFLVVDPGTLLPGNPFAEQMSQLGKAIQATPRRPGVEEIRIPSQRAFRERERRRAEGILVDAAVIAALKAL